MQGFWTLPPNSLHKAFGSIVTHRLEENKGLVGHWVGTLGGVTVESEQLVSK